MNLACHAATGNAAPELIVLRKFDLVVVFTGDYRQSGIRNRGAATLFYRKSFRRYIGEPFLRKTLEDSPWLFALTIKFCLR